MAISLFINPCLLTLTLTAGVIPTVALALMGGPLSGSIKGDTHQLNHTSELRDAAVKTLAMINVLNGSDDKNVE